MNKLIVLVFIAAPCTFFGMKIEEYKSKGLIQFFVLDVKEPDNIVALNQLFNDDKRTYINQWWYLDHVLSHESTLGAVCFENDGKTLPLITTILFYLFVLILQEIV